MINRNVLSVAHRKRLQEGPETKKVPFQKGRQGNHLTLMRSQNGHFDHHLEHPPSVQRDQMTIGFQKKTKENLAQTLSQKDHLVSHLALIGQKRVKKKEVVLLRRISLNQLPRASAPFLNFLVSANVQPTKHLLGTEKKETN